MRAVATDLAEEEKVRKLQEARPPGLYHSGCCLAKAQENSRGEEPGLKNLPWEPSCGPAPAAVQWRQELIASPWGFQETRMGGLLLLKEEHSECCKLAGPVPGGHRWPFEHTGLRWTRPGPAFNLETAAFEGKD